jgi:hypothetical protein
MDMFNIKSKDFRDFKDHMDLKKPSFGGPNSSMPFDKRKSTKLKGYTNIAKRDPNFENGGRNVNYDNYWKAFHSDVPSRSAKIKTEEPMRAIPTFGTVEIKVARGVEYDEVKLHLFEEFMFEADEDDMDGDSDKSSEDKDLPEIDENLIEDFIEEFGDDIKEIIEISCEKMELSKDECLDLIKVALERIAEMPEEDEEESEDAVPGLEGSDSDYDDVDESTVNESVLLTLGGIALGAGVIKKAYDYIANKMLDKRMQETGNVKKGSNGIPMKEYRDSKTDEIYWGIDVTDKTRDEGYQKRNILLFKNDPERIEKILNSEIHHDLSDEARMKDDFGDKFGQFHADKKIYKGSY